MLGANLELLLYGEVSVMSNFFNYRAHAMEVLYSLSFLASAWFPVWQLTDSYQSCIQSLRTKLMRINLVLV